jgi:hypothetical protein
LEISVMMKGQVTEAIVHRACVPVTITVTWSTAALLSIITRTMLKIDYSTKNMKVTFTSR